MKRIPFRVFALIFALLFLSILLLRIASTIVYIAANNPDLLDESAMADENIDMGANELSPVQLSQYIILKASDISTPVVDFVFSPDGNRIATLSGAPPSAIQIWDTLSGKPLQTLMKPPNWFPLNIEFTLNGQQLIGSGLLLSNPDMYQPVVWDAETGDLVTRGEAREGRITQITISPDGESLVGGVSIQNQQDFTSSGAIYSWDIRTLNNIKTILVEPEGEVSHIAFLPDGNLVYVVNQSLQPTQIGLLLTPSNMVERNNAVTPGHIKLWNYQTQEVESLYTDEASIRALAVSLTDSLIATSSTDKTVKIWDLSSKEVEFTLPNVDVQSLSFSPDGKLLATDSTISGYVQLWEVVNGRLLITQQNSAESISQIIRKIKFSSDGEFLAVGNQGGFVHFWKIQWR